MQPASLLPLQTEYTQRSEWCSLYSLLHNSHHVCLDKKTSSRISILRNSWHCHRHAETPLICCCDTAAPRMLGGVIFKKGLRFLAMYGGWVKRGWVTGVFTVCAWVGNVLLSSLHFSASSQNTLACRWFILREEGLKRQRKVSLQLTPGRAVVLQGEIHEFILGSGGRKWRGAFVAWKVEEKLCDQCRTPPAKN